MGTQIPWFKIAIGASVGVFGLLVWKTAKTRPLGAFDMLKVIAAESRTPEEYARRAEAWASGESTPPPMAKLTRFKKVSPAKMHALILKARDARVRGSRARHERFVAQPDEDEDDLDGARLDRGMARQSLKEEREAISVYTKRLAKAESPKLKKALVHARKEEREHAAAFKSLAGLPKDVDAIAKKLNAKIAKLEADYRVNVMDRMWHGEVTEEEFRRAKAAKEDAIDEIDTILVPLLNPRPSKKVLDAARAYAKKL